MFLKDTAKAIGDWFNDWNFDPMVVGAAWFMLLVFGAILFDPDVISATLAMVVWFSPIWLPVFLFNMFWLQWMHYIRYMFWFNQSFVLLEITLPPEVEKSPAAMELFLSGIWNAGGESTFLARIWEGKFRAVWSLEIASNEGRIAYYIHTRKAWRTIIESRLYGQYPEAKITEVEDYAAKVPFNLDEYSLYGLEYAKGDPQAMPIKSYVDYQLDKDTDTPETKVDPIANTLELMGSLGQGEYMWLQIIIKARKKDEWYGFYLSENRWKEPAQKKIQDITTGAVKRAQKVVDELKGDATAKAQAISRAQTLLSEGEKKQIEAIERSLNKLVFECGARGLYFAKKNRFQGINIGALINIYAPFRSPDFNNLGPARGLTDFDYPWQDFMEIRQNLIRRKMFFRYKHRAHFYVPYDQKPTFLTTEELATLWHFPGSWIKTPGVQRVASRRAEAPSNLPVLPS